MATYISNGSGDWTTTGVWLTAADGALTPTAAAGVAPQSGARDRIIIRSPHTITYNTSGVFGNGGNGNNFGTTTQNILNASMILSGGRLRASRTVNTALTGLGTIWVDANGSFWDWGTASDPVSAVTATIAMSGVSAGACGMVVKGSTSNLTLTNSACFWGLEKTRNTFLTLPAAAGQPVITVDNAYNWNTNDELVIESDTISTTRALTGVRIQSINGKNITLNTNLNFARLSGTRVGNFTSTVTYETLPSSPMSFGIIVEGLFLGNYQFGYISLKDFGNYWRDTGVAYIVVTQGAINYNAAYNKIQPPFKGIAHTQTRSPAVNYASLSLINPGTDELLIDDFAFNGGPTFGNNQGIYFGGNSFAKLTNSVFYRSFNPIYPVNTLKTTINNCNINSENVAIGLNTSANNGIRLAITNSKIRSNNSLMMMDNFLNTEINTCNIATSATSITRASTNAFGTTTLTNCTLSGPSYTIGSNIRTIKDFNFNIFNANNDSNYITFNYYHYAQANSSIRKNGITSFAITPKASNEAFAKIFTTPAVQGVTQKIKGNLRFDSNYGTDTPPSITFGNAVSNTTFTCPAVANTWHSFEYDLTPNITGDIELTITGQSTKTNGFVYVDGLMLDPFVKSVRWYGFEVDKNLYRTVDTLTTLTENQVSSVDITNLDRLYDASNYWTINNPLSTSYLDLYTKNGDILNFGDKNIVLNNSASTNFAYASASKTITIKTPLLSAGNNFIGLRTTGNIYLSSGSTIDNIDIYGNAFQATPVNLSDIYMEGTLAYNTETPVTIEYKNCSMGTVQNDGSAIVTIKKTNSIITNGLDDQIFDYVPTILNVTLNGGYIAIFDNNETKQYYQNTDGTIILPSNAIGTWKYRIANYGYDFIQDTFEVDPNTGATITISPNYSPDIYLTSNAQTVSAYSDLNTSQKIYNYLSYWTTTSTGIEYIPFYSRAVGNITINKNVTLDSNASTLLNYNSSLNLLTLRSSGLNEDLIFASTGAISAINDTTYSNDIKIRANNIDSEFLFDSITSLTFFPSENDRDANTNPGEVLTGNINRFKFGSIVKGVTYSGLKYARVNVDGTVLLYSYTIIQGRNSLEFGTVGTLQLIINNQKIINEGVQKASKLIPHTTNI
jgi:hypothetical protein